MARKRHERGVSDRRIHLGLVPRPVGSHLAVNENGKLVGSVSGGCIERGCDRGDGSHEKWQAKGLEYGVTNELAWEVGLACGGSIHVYVEKVE